MNALTHGPHNASKTQSERNHNVHIHALGTGGHGSYVHVPDLHEGIVSLLIVPPH